VRVPVLAIAANIGVASHAMLQPAHLLPHGLRTRFLLRACSQARNNKHEYIIPTT
jgi:hypothetical protein